MNSRLAAVLILSLWLYWPVQRGSGQTNPASPLATQPPASGHDYTLQDCQLRVKQWEAWSAQTGSFESRLQSDNQQLTERNLLLESRLASLRSERNKTIITYMAFGAGFFVALMVWRILLALRPLTSILKQLVVLLLGAAWVTIAALLAAVNPQLVAHPANWAFVVSIYSIPAILFCAIGMWWFAKEKSEPATHGPS